ncbi:hypothetical protein KEM54_002127 [Ascosphaera aggregata]|nr:hypothetical protein KEM54_002127 [Ascosphaera aggregata]
MSAQLNSPSHSNPSESSTSLPEMAERPVSPLSIRSAVSVQSQFSSAESTGSADTRYDSDDESLPLDEDEYQQQDQDQESLPFDFFELAADVDGNNGIEYGVDDTEWARIDYDYWLDIYWHQSIRRWLALPRHLKDVEETPLPQLFRALPTSSTRQHFSDWEIRQAEEALELVLDEDQDPELGYPLRGPQGPLLANRLVLDYPPPQYGQRRANAPGNQQPGNHESSQ